MTGFLRDFTGRRSAGLIAHGTEPGEGRAAPCLGGHSFPIAGAECVLCGEPRFGDDPEAPPTPLPPERQEPDVGDRVTWQDGSTGIVAHVREPWIEPGEAVVYRHAELAHPGGPTYMVEAGSLVADHTLPTGETVFTYRGSLR